MGSGFEIEIHLAGPFRVLGRDGTDLTPRGARAKGLLTLVALAPSLRRSRSFLQDRLWSDRGPEQGAASLRQVLVELRQCLGENRSCLVTDDGCVGLDPGLVRVVLEPAEPRPFGDAPELAEGLDIPDPEFEDWIRDRRLEYEDHLGRLSADRAPDPSPPPTDPAGVSWFARHAPLSRLVAAGVPVLLVALLASVWIPAGRPTLEPTAPAVQPAGRHAVPSIAVMRFQALGDDPGHQAFVDGISRDIGTDLSSFGTLLVIAAPSVETEGVAPHEVGQDLGVRYVLTGTAQPLGSEIRVNVQLVETASARHVWAQRFDGPADDLPGLQNEIVRHVVDVIGPLSGARGKLRQAELERVSLIPSDSLQAYDLYLKGVVDVDVASSESNRSARYQFERAVGLDPLFAEAHAMLSWTYLNEYWRDWTETPSAALANAEVVALQAVAIDPAQPHSHWALGSVRLFQRRHDEAIDAFRTSVELNPNDADILMHQGWALTYVGEPDLARETMERAIERSPYVPGYYLWDLAWGQFVGRNYRQCVETLERRYPKSSHTHLLSAACHAMLGNEAEADGQLVAFRTSEPRFSVQTAARVEPFASDADLRHYLAALRAAGLPDRSKPEEGSQPAAAVAD